MSSFSTSSNLSISPLRAIQSTSSPLHTHFDSGQARMTRWVFCFFLFFFFSLSFSERAREITLTQGATLIKDLSEDFSLIVDTIVYDIGDAYDGAKTHTKYDASLYSALNKLHIESKPTTISKRLLFKKGSLITKELLMETEKVLRKEEYLADAIIEVIERNNGKAKVIVHTFDHWSTVPAASFNKIGGVPIYYVGLIESNLLGLGQKVGLLFEENLDRKSVHGFYAKNDFLFQKVKLSMDAIRSSDGYSYSTKINKPLESKTQQWGFSLNGFAIKKTKYLYESANKKNELDRRVQSSKNLNCNLFFTCKTLSNGLLLSYNNVTDLSFNAKITRSYGLKHKFNSSPVFTVFKRYQTPEKINEHLRQTITKYKKDSLIINGVDSSFITVDSSVIDSIYLFRDLYGSTPEALSQYKLDYRQDIMFGWRFDYYQYSYKTVKNFRNLKWNEDIDVGFRISTEIKQNLKLIGAKTNDLFLFHQAVYNNIWASKIFLLTSLSSYYYLNYNGVLEDGLNSHFFEVQWKPLKSTSSYFSSTWKNYFAKEKSAQLTLGELNGFNGFPNYFFTGQASWLMTLEQRYFPNIEIGTLIPAFATFLQAGNTFPSYRDFIWDDLHYSAGIGLRTGLSRSTQGVVNHLNISAPLNSKYYDALNWTLSIVAKASL